MTDPKTQAEKQLARVLETIERTVDIVTKEVRAANLEKHGQMVKHFKAEYGIGHGDANLLAHTVREALAGGPSSSSDLLDAQYAGKKESLRPIFNKLADVARGLGADVDEVVQKTGVSFRRKRQFALITAPSSKRVRLGLNLAEQPDDERVKETKGMCKQGIDLVDVSDVDDDVAGWLKASYESAG